MIKVAFTKIQSKIKINNLMSDFLYPYVRSSSWISAFDLVTGYCN